MLKKSKLLTSLVAVLLFCCGLFASCGKNKSIEIYLTNKDYSIEPGKSVVLECDLKEIKAENLEYFIVGDGAGSITNDGKLVANKDAKVGSTIVIKAKSKADKVESNELTFTVVDRKPQNSIVLKTATGSLAITKDSEISLVPVFDGEDDIAITLRGVDYTIIKGAEFAELNGGILKIKEGATPASNSEIVVKGVSKANADLETTITIKYIVPKDYSQISANNVEIFANNASTNYLEIEYLDDELNIIGANNLDFTYSSGDEKVANVLENGKIEVKGHGTTTITIISKANPSVQTTCTVSVVATPKQIEFSEENHLSTQIINTNKITFGMKNIDNISDKLNLLFKGTNAVEGITASQNFKYTIKKNNTICSDSVAKFDSNSGFEFFEEGLYEITVTSDSKTGKVDVSTVKEVSFTFDVQVNNGLNVRKVADLVTYSNQDSNTTANILCDLNLTEKENFEGRDLSVSPETNNYHGLTFVGDRYINGNGYVLSAMKLPIISGSTSGGDSMLKFVAYIDNDYENIHRLVEKKDDPFTVQINDFSIIGQGTVNGTHVNYLNTSVVHQENNKFKCIYNRGIEINDEKFKDSSNKNLTSNYVQSDKAYVKNMVISNVKVSNFYVGLRICHAVEGKLNKVEIDQCFSNGFESVQNTITLKDMKLGVVGAFGIEITPDDIVGEKSTPRGTSGEGFDLSQSIKFEGTIDSDNYNNGTTPYMQGLGDMINSLTSGQASSLQDVVNAITGGTVGKISSTFSEDVQDKVKEALTTLLKSLMFKNIDGDDCLNYYLLVFNNIGYSNGNKEVNGKRLFANYPDSELINVIDVLSNYAGNFDGTTGKSTYTAYKGMKYLLLDLDTGTTNFGQIILVNQAYDPNYSSSTQGA